MSDKKSNGNSQHPPAAGSHAPKDVHKIAGGHQAGKLGGGHPDLKKK